MPHWSVRSTTGYPLELLSDGRSWSKKSRIQDAWRSRTAVWDVGLRPRGGMVFAMRDDRRGSKPFLRSFGTQGCKRAAHPPLRVQVRQAV